MNLAWRLDALAQAVWYQPRHPLAGLLAPLGLVFCTLARVRAWNWRRHWRGDSAAAPRLGAPVIVVGNLTLGGTGKTPLVLWLAETLGARGWRPGILTRGYLGRSTAGSRLVPANGDPRDYGDEAVLLAGRSGVPVMVGRDRVASARALIDQQGCDLLIADDGLQHYRLRRDLEILLIDGRRGLGNGRCLPAGPLREPPARARRADLVVSQGGPQTDKPRLDLRPERAIKLIDPRQTRALVQFTGAALTAVAGIGHPEPFFALLERHGLRPQRRPYPDHYPYTSEDVRDWPVGTVLMTEKDAVKCRPFATQDHWYLPVTAQPNAAFLRALEPHFARLESARRGLEPHNEA